MVYGIGGNYDSGLFEVDVINLNVREDVDYTSKASYTVNVTSDIYIGAGEYYRLVDVMVTGDANTIPMLDPIGSKSVSELQPLTFTAAASDDFNDSLEFSLGAGAPSGATINPNTGSFSWTPTEEQDGPITITVQVEDRAGATASGGVQVNVAEINVAPVLNPIGPKSVDELELLTFPVTASDSDVINGVDDALEFSLGAGAPSGATINPNTGLFSWTPAAGQTGSYPITIQVSDGAGLTASEDITVTVGGSNQNPVLVSIGDMSVSELQPLTFPVTASDADNDTLEFTLVGTPPTGASITSGGAFSWTPTERQDGTRSITVQVSDGNGGSDSETFTVAVAEVNTPPVLDSIGSQGVNLPNTLTFTATASDSDVIGGMDDALQFSLDAGSPLGATIDSATGLFSWTPTAGQTGMHTITIRVSDGSGATDSEGVGVTVTEGGTNLPPDLNAMPPQSGDELEPITFTATATDPDGDPLSFSLQETIPAGASITRGGFFSWTPSTDQVGSHDITVAVSDGRGGTDTETVAITVIDVPPRQLSARAVQPDSVSVAFSETVTSSGTGPNGFSVESGGDSVSVDSITGSGTKSLVLGLTGSISAPATLSYSGEGDVEDSNDTQLEQFSGLPISFQSKKSRSVAPPAITADSQGYASSAIPEWAMQAAPEGPLQPVPADGTPYPLIIDQNGYALHSSPSTVIPTQVAAGQTVTIKVTIHDPTPIAYFAIYLNLQGNDISHLDSDAQIIWDSGQAYVVDRSGLMQDVAITILEDPDDPAKKTATITVTFSDSMGETNMVIRTWNAAGQITEVKIFDALDVRTQEPEPVAVDPEPGTEPNTADPEPGAVPVTAPGVADSQSAAGPDADRDTLAIRMWSGFEPESISDAQLLASLGLDYPGMDIPSWVMTELGPLVAKGDITAGEFKTALEYVLEHVLEHS